MSTQPTQPAHPTTHCLGMGKSSPKWPVALSRQRNEGGVAALSLSYSLTALDILITVSDPTLASLQSSAQHMLCIAAYCKHSCLIIILSPHRKQHCEHLNHPSSSLKYEPQLYLPLFHLVNWHALYKELFLHSHTQVLEGNYSYIHTCTIHRLFYNGTNSMCAYWTLNWAVSK